MNDQTIIAPVIGGFYALAFIVVVLIVLACIAPPGFDAQKWPPIDDDEFIRRCKPGVNRDTALRVRRIISRHLGVPYEQVYPEQRFEGDLF